MVAAIYTGANATAVRLIAKFGKACTLAHTSAPTYNPETGQATGGTVTQNGTCIELGYDAKDIDGTTILRGDKKFLLSTSGITAALQLEGKFTTDGVTYTIKGVNSTNPGGLTLLHEIQARK